MIYYVAGLFAGAFLPVLPQGPWLFAAPWVLLCGPWRRYGTPFWLGLLLAVTYGHWQLWHRFTPEAPRDQWLSGEVVGLPRAGDGSVRFELKVTGAVSPRLRQVRLNWYEPQGPLQPGDLLHLRVRLRPPHGLSNPGGFDYERWALARSIDAVGYVRCCVERRGHRRTLDRLRARIGAYLTLGLLDPDVAGLARALLIGDRGGLDASDWARLRRTGTVHLVVVSGLHIGILVGLGWLLGRGLCRLRPRQWGGERLLRVLPVVSALLLSGAYVLLAGAGLSTLRAWIMAAVLLLSGLSLQRVSVWRRWWLALAVVLSWQPLAVWEPGLWLSFGAVAALLLLSHERTVGAPWRRLGRAQVAVFVLVSPLLLGWFAQLSLLGPLVNLVAIPLLPLLLVGLAPVLLGFWLGFDLPARLYAAVVGWLWHGLGALSHWPIAAWALAVPPFAVLLLSVPAGMALVLPLALRMRLLAMLIWALALFAPMRNEGGGRFRAWVFDVGQGLAVLVRAGGRTLLYDTGPAYRSGGAAFERAVLPYLRREGIAHLDALIISHDNSDHAGGRWQVLRALSVSRRLSGSSSLQVEEGYAPCVRGQAWQWGAVHFRMLYGGRGDNENDRSCVLRVDAGSCSLLLTGDVERDVEFELVRRGGLRPLTWLVAPHHGSASSSSVPFLEALQPRYGLFSAGYLNAYGHPAPEVVVRYRALGAHTLNTAFDGALELSQDDDGRCRTRAWRVLKKRYWSEG